MSDHDHTDNPSSGQVQVDPSASAAPVAPGLEDVTIVAWQQNCTQCHGQLGRGDGPRGPMVKATNLSDPAWQASATDEQIAAVIKNGKGAMPALNLPDGTVANLVKLVRMMNAAKADAQGAPSGTAPSGTAPGAAPSGSARSPAPKTSTSASAKPAAPVAPGVGATPAPKNTAL